MLGRPDPVTFYGTNGKTTLDAAWNMGLLAHRFKEQCTHKLDICTYIYTVYIKRERERERKLCLQTPVAAGDSGGRKIAPNQIQDPSRKDQDRRDIAN